MAKIKSLARQGLSRKPARLRRRVTADQWERAQEIILKRLDDGCATLGLSPDQYQRILQTMFPDLYLGDAAAVQENVRELLRETGGVRPKPNGYRGGVVVGDGRP